MSIPQQFQDVRGFITTFQAPDSLTELQYFHRKYDGTNLDVLLSDGSETNWSVDKKAQIGDIVFFYCAKTSIDSNHMGGIRKKAYARGDQALIDFAEDQYAKYKACAGKIIAMGLVSSAVTKEDWYRADIDHLVLLPNPVSREDFKAFIRIQQQTITKLANENLLRLLSLVDVHNPGLLSDWDMHLEQLYLAGKLEAEVSNLSTDELIQKASLIHNEHVETYVTQTVLKKRNPLLVLAAKARAGGVCQWCGQMLDYTDHTGAPYLEVHHIIPLSEGGPDELSNMIALCPNCHRRMHRVHNPKDIALMRKRIST